MKTPANKNVPWNQKLIDHAHDLELQAAVARFVALAETRRDALAATWDLAMMAVHAKVANAAVRTRRCRAAATGADIALADAFRRRDARADPRRRCRAARRGD